MDEYIKREKVIHEIDTWLDSVGTALVGKGLSYYGELLGCVEDVPAADVAPVRHGRWIAVEEHIYLADGVCKEWTNFYCSICDTPNNSPTNYCPNCGAKMDEVSE